ncbi:MAG: phosphoribosyl-AMP cyclohydrolase [Candidatus Bathyarchaeia archaeon]
MEGEVFKVSSHTVNLKEVEKLADSLNYKHNGGFVVAVAQDVSTGEVLMVAFMNKEAFIRTLTTGLAHYWSLSRKKLWRKGEESGHIQLVKEVYIDCDRDSVLLKVNQIGYACHEGYKSCFHYKV